MEGGRQPHPWPPIRQGVIPLINAGPSCHTHTLEGGPGCCFPPSTAPLCMGDHQGIIGRYLMNFYRWRVAIPSDCKNKTPAKRSGVVDEALTKIKVSMARSNSPTKESDIADDDALIWIGSSMARARLQPRNLILLMMMPSDDSEHYRYMVGRMWRDEHGQSKGTSEEQRQQASDVEAGGEISQVISSKKPASGNKRSMAKPSKSEAHKSGASLANQQIKVKASMPHEAKMPKENEDKASPPTFGKRLDSILVPSNDEVSSKAKEGKNVEALMKNMDEALAKNMKKALTKPAIYCKIIVGEANEPSLLDSIVGLVEAVLEKGMPYLAVASKDSIPLEDEINVDEPTMSISKKAISSRKIMSRDKSFSVPTKLSDIDNMHNKAKKVMIENASINLCVAVKHMEVTPFVKMDEEFFYLCKDAINDAKSINFKVGGIQAGKGIP
ncbi:hypothetical protein SLEP1_g49667 [Rubroshorea leprosula]|uniref:Uncharacterized protein n=1 Tax=Rubroshorea leprosula TaxID=152421 RepID=A0AAV5LYH2_9ROSI|nr:hypothetical protein SLEP1_g49667 [Rubroshorea leprosula]